MKIQIKNLSEKKNNCVLISCKKFNIFIESSEFYDLQQIFFDNQKNLNDVKNKFQQRIKFYKKTQTDVKNYVVFYKENFAYFYFLFQDLFNSKNFKVISSLLQMREFVKIIFQLEKNFHNQKNFENIIDLEQEKKFVFLTYNQNFQLIKQICYLDLLSSGAFFGSFYARINIINKQMLFFGNFSQQQFLLSKKLNIDDKKKSIFCFLKPQNKLIETQQKQIQQLVQQIESKVNCSSQIFSYYINTDIIDIVFQLKHRNRFLKIIVISQTFSDFILRNITLTEYVNQIYSQNIYFPEPKPYFDTLKFQKEKSLLLFKDLSQFCKFVSQNYEFIKNNKFIIFENCNQSQKILKSMKNYTKVEVFVEKYQAEYQNDIQSLCQVYPNSKNFAFFSFETTNDLKSIKPHNSLMVKFNLINIDNIIEDGLYYIRQVFSSKDYKTAENLGNKDTITKLQIKNFDIQNLSKKLQQNEMLLLDQINQNHLKFLDLENFLSFEIKSDNKIITIFCNKNSLFQKILEIIESSTN